MTSVELVESYFKKNFRPVFWPHIGDSKGPREPGWPQHLAVLEEYHEGHRVGLLMGVESSPGKFLHDVDIDWAGGIHVAMKMLPETEFVFGRASKKISHCFYLLPEALPSFRYEDIDKTCLLELRGTKSNGEIGLQTMVPPSIWTKNGQREELIFVKNGKPTFHEGSSFKQRVCLTAIGMLLVRHLGVNGFGHEVQLAFAGFLLRLGIPVEDVILLGESIAVPCNHIPLSGVRTTIISTSERMHDPKQKIKGGPAFIKLIGEKGASVLERISEWLGRDSDFIRNKEGAIIKDSQENIRRAIMLCDTELSYNQFAEKMLVKDHGGIRPLDDHLNDSLWLRIDREYHFRSSKIFFDTVVRNITRDAEFHPVRDYLVSLSWDGVPRLDTWLIKYGKSPDTEYHRAVAAIVLIAAVQRIRNPGCKYDEMLVLESPQGMNKSTALRALCPRDDWFSDDLPLNVDAKQIIERTLGKWIIEASDLAGKRKTEVEQLKAMLSRQTDGPARMAYAHFPVERARQFIIIGTTNSTAYLTDPTGARRFWPIKLRGFDIEAIIRDRDQLWAEAMVRDQAGEPIRLPQRLWKLAAEYQDERREIDAWEDPIRDLVEFIKPGPSGRRQIAALTLWEAIQPDVTRRDTLGGRRISEIMHRLGFQRSRIRVEGKVVIGYINDQEMLNFEGE